MRNLRPLTLATLVALSLFALVVGAEAAPGIGGAQSQAGGLPALQGRVEALENSLKSDVDALQNQINSLEAATAFISMNGDGSINYFKGVDPDPPFTVRTGTGAYQVRFTRNVSQCVAVASVHPPVGPITPAFAMVSRASSTQVSVAIFDLTGLALDDGFELAVIC